MGGGGGLTAGLHLALLSSMQLCSGSSYWGWLIIRPEEWAVEPGLTSAVQGHRLSFQKPPAELLDPSPVSGWN